MTRQQLYLNGELVDLPAGDAIALTFQTNDLANLQDRQSTFSNLIELPKTANNKRICGYSDSVNFGDYTPYSFLACKYIVNGYEVIPRGNASIQEAGDVFKVQLTYGLRGFMDIVGDLKLHDVWNTQNSSGMPYLNRSASTVADSQTVKSGVIWPLIDNGLLTSSTVNVKNIYPAFFTHTILEYIQSFTGYAFTGDVFSYAEYLNELIPFSNDEYNNNGALPNLPDITIKDFLKDFMQRYFLTPSVDNYKRTIQFFSFNEVYDNKSLALDWTDKFVQGELASTFVTGNYGQNNFLRMRADDNVSKDLGTGSFKIANTTLDINYDAVESVFAGSVYRTDYSNINPTVIRRAARDGQAGDLTINVQPRILINRRVQGGINFIDEFGGSHTPGTVSAPYFKLPGLNGAGYDDHLTLYGTGLVKILSKFRMLSRPALLKANDVLKIDFSIPVYDATTSAYYYLNKITNWVPGKVCDVQLIKL